MKTTKQIANELKNELNSIDLFQFNSLSECKKIITDIVIEVTDWDAVDDNDAIIELVNGICDKYGITEYYKNFELDYEDNLEDFNFNDDIKYAYEPVKDIGKWLDSICVIKKHKKLSQKAKEDIASDLFNPEVCNLNNLNDIADILSGYNIKLDPDNSKDMELLNYPNEL